MNKTTFCILLCVAMLSCNKSKYFPDNCKYNTEIFRFDSALITMDTEDIYKETVSLYKTYPIFTPIFIENIIGMNSADTLSVSNALEQFLNDTLYGFRQTNEKVLAVFEDISPVKTQLDKAFGRIQYLYPILEIPEIWFMVSGFNSSLFFWNDEKFKENMAVGSDMYLGSDYEYYNKVVYNYQKSNMRPECMPVDIVSAFMFKNFPYNYNKNRLIDNIIYRGKIMYCVSLIFDTTENYEVMGYSKEQWDWCRKNESEIWKLMIDKHDLFKSESLLLTSYLNDGPFTSEISQDSPARIGIWIGWQIVESYMKNNDVSLQELIANNDAQLILEQSNYRP